MQRVAILHFTAEPCIGGVERVIETQRAVLGAEGYAVRLIVGAGGEEERGETVRIPQLLPDGDTRSAEIPSPAHPRVRELKREIKRALAGCSHCWVHNALTVYLNPFLTVALSDLIREMPALRWAIFCHDLTQRTVYWRTLTPEEHERVALPLCGERYVVDSEARREELAACGLAATEIRVIRPAVDIVSWLQLADETVQVVERVGALHAAPLILIPSKLLPHKNLELAVPVLSRLRRVAERPVLLITGPPSPHDETASGAVRARLQTLIAGADLSSSLYLLGELLGTPPARRTVHDLILLSDLVFLPSTEEGFGVPLQEAMALRSPILCSDIAPFRELAEGYAHFFDLDAGAEAIAGQIVEIAHSRENARRREALRSAESFRREIVQLVQPE